MRNCDAKIRNAKLSFPKRKTVIKNRKKELNFRASKSKRQEFTRMVENDSSGS